MRPRTHTHTHAHTHSHTVKPLPLAFQLSCKASPSLWGAMGVTSSWGSECSSRKTCIEAVTRSPRPYRSNDVQAFGLQD
eukprot:834972-Alexandrium_andersonii.AAC.1